MRRLVVCCDGMWTRPDQEAAYNVRRPTNILKIARAIEPVDESGGVSQIVYYDDGATTQNAADKLLGGAAGFGLESNILLAYRFLVLNYRKCDEIYLFGYSRGAFTVRSLSGMINEIGLVPKANLSDSRSPLTGTTGKANDPDDEYFLPDLYHHYQQLAKLGSKARNEYRSNNGIVWDRDARIAALSVFDTVGECGIPIGFRGELTRRGNMFPDVRLCTNVDHAYQAVAIDEKRPALKPCLWDRPVRPDQIMKQVWFAGVHSSLGGGYEDDRLSNCALHWIVENVRSIGLALDQDYLKTHAASYRGTFYQSVKGFYEYVPHPPRDPGAHEEGHEAIHQSAIDRWNNVPGYTASGVVIDSDLEVAQ